MSETTGSERAHLPVSAPPRNHGNTVAAWVTVIVVMVGGLVGTLGVMASSALVFWVGIGVVAAGLVAGRILRMVGMGQPPEPAARGAQQG